MLYEEFRGSMKSTFSATLAILLLLLVVQSSSAQNNTPQIAAPPSYANVGVTFANTTGNPGLSGVSAFGGLRYKSVELVGEFDQSATNINFPDTITKAKIREQDYLFGPRIYLGRVFANPKFTPFGNLLFGISHQTSDITGVAPGSSSDTSYSWDFGGGVDYRIGRHWAARGRVSAFRTHFTDESQTHLRWGGGVVYLFSRK
jgi:hypothetical protein